MTWLPTWTIALTCPSWMLGVQSAGSAETNVGCAVLTAPAATAGAAGNRLSPETAIDSAMTRVVVRRIRGVPSLGGYGVSPG